MPGRFVAFLGVFVGVRCVFADAGRGFPGATAGFFAAEESSELSRAEKEKDLTNGAEEYRSSGLIGFGKEPRTPNFARGYQRYVIRPHSVFAVYGRYA
jgi:hypothetical protein